MFRFEPFLLHVECRDMAAANALLNAARLAGFRESGATVGSSNARIIVSQSLSWCLFRGGGGCGASELVRLSCVYLVSEGGAAGSCGDRPATC